MIEEIQNRNAFGSHVRLVAVVRRVLRCRYVGKMIGMQVGVYTSFTHSVKVTEYCVICGASCVALCPVRRRMVVRGYGSWWVYEGTGLWRNRTGWDFYEYRDELPVLRTCTPFYNNIARGCIIDKGSGYGADLHTVSPA